MGPCRRAPLRIIKVIAPAPRMAMMSLEPAVVKWIVDSSGMAHADLAERLRVDAATLGGWIKTGRMEYGRMQAMAKYVKRPEALFLLKTPPEEENVPDFRMAGGAAGSLGPEDRITVRRARYAQYVAGDMIGMLGTDPEPAIGGVAAVGDPPEEIAQRESKVLGLECSDGRVVRGGACGFHRSLRDSVERRNILVFQDALDIDTVRGISLTSAVPYTILINSRDTDEAKSFTLLHEYGHVLLRRGGICREQAGPGPALTRDQKIEAWCNRFAASVLMPRGPFMDELERLERTRLDAETTVEDLAKKFKTSRYAAAVRAVDILGSTRGRAYKRLVGTMANKFAFKVPKRTNDSKGRGFASPVDRCISRLGRKFVRLTLESYEKKTINSREFIEYLKTDLKHLDKLRQRVSSNA